MDAVTKALRRRIEDHQKRIKSVVKPWGKELKDGPLYVAYFERMAMEVFPPEPWVMPDGTVALISPWVAALPYIEGGEDAVKKYLAAKAAMGVM